MIKFYFFLISTTILYTGLSQGPIIKKVETTNSVIGLYEKYEASIDLTANYQNPFNYDEVELRAIISTPGGALDTIDGFYTEDRVIDVVTGNTTVIGPPTFKIRYAPRIEGNYQYFLMLTDSVGTVISDEYTFRCDKNGNTNNRGFIRTNNTNYLNFDDEGQYIPIGENMGWQKNNAFLDYSRWLEGLINVNANFIRIWHSHFGLGIEWKNGWDEYHGLMRYNQETSTYHDWLVDYCAENGIYMMVALQHHGQVSTQVNPNWSSNPYNIVNGGPIVNTWDFFIDSTAIAISKNRLRYIVARWGYSRSIMSWELFNEVEWTDNYAQYEENIIDWHLEMADFIRQKDVNDHLITTSFANDRKPHRLWDSQLMDFTQAHFYRNIGNIYNVVNGLTTSLIDTYQKPSLVGEFGLSGGSEVNLDKDGIYIHNTLWASMLGGAMGTAMPWNWDDYIFQEDLYHHFLGLTKIEKEIPFLEMNMNAGTISTKGAATDLVLNPVLSWAGIADSSFVIQEGGNTIPANPELSSFLYGAISNTQYRSPPVFKVNYSSGGLFSVTTGNQVSTLARVEVTIDDEVVIDSLAKINTVYEISIPKGNHIIKVDNKGTDWVSIASYLFSDQGSKIGGNVILSYNGKAGAGWIVNKDYNHLYIAADGLPEPITEASLVIDNVRNFPYRFTWFDTFSGTRVSSTTVEVENNKLVTSIPEIYWDLAFTIQIDNSVSTKQIPRIPFEIYPNPIKRGNRINFSFENTNLNYSITIYNAEGKPMLTKQNISSLSKIKITNNWPVGIYWLMISDGGRSNAKPFIVID